MAKKYFEDYTVGELNKLTYEEIKDIPVKRLKLSISDMNFPKGTNMEISGVKGLFYTDSELNQINKKIEILLIHFERYYNTVQRAEEIMECFNPDNKTSANLIKIKQYHINNSKKIIKELI